MFISLLFQGSFVTLNGFCVESYKLQPMGHNNEQEEEKYEGE